MKSRQQLDQYPVLSAWSVTLRAVTESPTLNCGRIGLSSGSFTLIGLFSKRGQPGVCTELHVPMALYASRTIPEPLPTHPSGQSKRLHAVSIGENSVEASERLRDNRSK